MSQLQDSLGVVKFCDLELLVALVAVARRRGTRIVVWTCFRHEPSAGALECCLADQHFDVRAALNVDLADASAGRPKLNRFQFIVASASFFGAGSPIQGVHERCLGARCSGRGHEARCDAVPHARICTSIITQLFRRWTTSEARLDLT